MSNGYAAAVRDTDADWFHFAGCFTPSHAKIPTALLDLKIPSKAFGERCLKRFKSKFESKTW